MADSELQNYEPIQGIPTAGNGLNILNTMLETASVEIPAGVTPTENVSESVTVIAV